MLERTKVVLAAAVTWIGVASTVVTIVWSEVVAAEVLPSGAVETGGRYVGVGLVVLVGLVNIIRRVTPVIPAQRGLIAKG